MVIDASITTSLILLYALVKCLWPPLGYPRELYTVYTIESCLNLEAFHQEELMLYHSMKENHYSKNLYQDTPLRLQKASCIFLTAVRMLFGIITFLSSNLVC